MIKGAQKKMIVVKTADSAVFEEVYFVMRRESNAERLDMLSEANRIIESSGGHKKRGRNKRAIRVLLAISAFVCGGILGGVITALFLMPF